MVCVFPPFVALDTFATRGGKQLLARSKAESPHQLFSSQTRKSKRASARRRSHNLGGRSSRFHGRRKRPKTCFKSFPLRQTDVAEAGLARAATESQSRGSLPGSWIPAEALQRLGGASPLPTEAESAFQSSSTEISHHARHLWL